MSMKQLKLEREGAVAIVTFDLPDGYMDEETVPELAGVVDEVEDDDSIRAIVMTGAQPGVFIRHYSIPQLAERGQEMRAQGVTFDENDPVPERLLHASMRRIEESQKPFVAAINGTCMGGGFEIALRCDIRLVEEGSYWLGLPEINLGIMPGAGGTQKLSALVGQARALELILLGRTFSPRQSVEMGLASECCGGPVLELGLKYAHELATKAPRALAYCKRLVRQSDRTDPVAGLALERTLFADLLVGEEATKLMAEMNAGKRDIRDR